MTNLDGTTADAKPANKDENLNDIVDDKAKEHNESNTLDETSLAKKKKDLLDIFKTKKKKERKFDENETIDCISKGRLIAPNSLEPFLRFGLQVCFSADFLRSSLQ